MEVETDFGSGGGMLVPTWFQTSVTYGNPGAPIRLPETFV